MPGCCGQIQTFFSRIKSKKTKKEVVTSRNTCKIPSNLISISQNQNTRLTMLPPLRASMMYKYFMKIACDNYKNYSNSHFTSDICANTCFSSEQKQLQHINFEEGFAQEKNNTVCSKIVELCQGARHKQCNSDFTKKIVAMTNTEFPQPELAQQKLDLKPAHSGPILGSSSATIQLMYML